MHAFPPTTQYSPGLEAVLIAMIAALCLSCVLTVWNAFRPTHFSSVRSVNRWISVCVVSGLILLGLLALQTKPGILLPGCAFVTFCVGFFATIKGIRNLNEAEAASTRTNGYFGLAILLAAHMMLLPTLDSGPEPARRTMCRSNLRQLALQFHLFHDDHAHFPVAFGPADGTEHGPAVSWRVSILPYLGHDNLLSQYDVDQAWDSVANQPIQKDIVRELQCPSVPLAAQTNEEGSVYTSYVVPTGPQTIFPDPGSPGKSIQDITDGTTNTLMIVEACGSRIIWTEPRDQDVRQTPVGINKPGRTHGTSDGLMSSYHQEAAMAAMADGSVRSLSTEIDPDILKKLTTASGGEDPGDGW